MKWSIKWDFLENSFLPSLLFGCDPLVLDRLKLKKLPFFPTHRKMSEMAHNWSPGKCSQPEKSQVLAASRSYQERGADCASPARTRLFYQLDHRSITCTCWGLPGPSETHTHTHTPWAVNGHRVPGRATSLTGGMPQWDGQSLCWYNNDLQKKYADSPCLLIEIRPWKGYYAAFRTMPINLLISSNYHPIISWKLKQKRTCKGTEKTNRWAPLISTHSPF